MDDELAALEAELARLRPVAPSAVLHATIGRRLTRRRRVPRVAWLALPLAAAAALTLVLNVRRIAAPATVPASAQAPVAAFDPVTAENVLVDSLDEGVVTLTDGTPARRVRQLYVDTITWRNPRTQASLRWTLPREEVRVLPISYQ
jgi:hypothetical protein